MKGAAARCLLTVVVVVVILVEWSVLVSAMMCLPCYDLETGDYVGPECPELLTVDDTVSCEPSYRNCGCCLECAGKVGDVCHQMTPP